MTDEDEVSTELCADDLVRRANVLYAEALIRRRQEEMADADKVWQTVGAKANAYWDRLDRPRPACRTTGTWIAIHAAQVADGIAPTVPPLEPITFAQLCLRAILCQEDGVEVADALIELTHIASRAGLTGEQVATALACYDEN